MNKNKVREFSEVLTPTKYVQMVCDMVPQEVWKDPTITFVEPSCGTGNIVDEIVKRRIEAGLSNQDIEQTFIGIEIQQESCELTKKRIKEKYDINVNVINSDTLTTIKSFESKRYVVIQNPPFNAPGRINQVRILYPDHILHIAETLKPELFISIHPHKYAVGGKGVEQLKDFVLKSKQIEEIRIFPNGKAIFPSVYTGPIQILKYNKNYNGPCSVNGTNRMLSKYDIIPIHDEYYSIIDKVLSCANDFVYETVKTQNWFGIGSGFSKWCDPSEPTAIPCLTKRGKINYIKYSDIKRKANIDASSVCVANGKLQNTPIQLEEKTKYKHRDTMLRNYDTTINVDKETLTIFPNHLKYHEKDGHSVAVSAYPIAGQEINGVNIVNARCPIAREQLNSRVCDTNHRHKSGKYIEQTTVDNGRFLDVTNEHDFVSPIKLFTHLQPYMNNTVGVPKIKNEGSTHNNETYKLLQNPYILEPGTVCSETYIIVNSLATYEEALNFQKYMMTKFFRFMVLTRVASQNITRRCYKWCPQMEHYNKEWKDAELYKMFNLSDEEIVYIEKRIKAYVIK